ncbi:CcdC family protein [Paenibacillus sp. 1P07SE]|uniref:CcdC family protein n=1 Tax=Paenibacillus sp. 1P07SE TaxID=3132209 RepID=UPI0039A77681
MPSTTTIQALSILISGMAGAVMILLRLRAARQPTSLKKLVIPPLGMMTGFIMFALPMMHIPWLWGLSAFGTGLLIFSFPLIVTTRLALVKRDIFVIRSKAFILIMVSLFALRLSLHPVVEKVMTIPQTGAIFYLVALGMILPWRLAMVSEYLRLIQRRAE